MAKKTVVPQGESAVLIDGSWYRTFTWKDQAEVNQKLAEKKAKGWIKDSVMAKKGEPIHVTMRIQADIPDAEALALRMD